MVLQVNGLNMQGVTHLEAVSALRNAGSCIKMKVLREGLHLSEVSVPDEPEDPQDVTGRQDGGGQWRKQQRMESKEGCLLKKREPVVCNGNGIVGSLLASQRKQKTLNKSHHCLLKWASSHICITTSKQTHFILIHFCLRVVFLFVFSLNWSET